MAPKPEPRVPEHGGKIHNDAESAKRAEEAANQKIQDFLNKQIKINENIIKDLIKELNNNPISKDSIEKNMKETMSVEDYNNASKALDDLNKEINNLLDNNNTLDEILKDLENKKITDIEDGMKNKPTTEQANSLNKYMEEQLSSMVDLLEKISPDLRKKIDNLDLTYDSSKTIKDNLDSVNLKFKKLLDSIDENAQKNYEKKLAEATLERLKKDGIPDIKESRPRSTLKDILKSILKLLMFLGSVGGLLWFLIDYITKHSGCNQIYQKSDDSPVLCNPIKCSIDNDDIINFTSIQCNQQNCNKHTSWTEACNKTSCKNLLESSYEKPYPNPIDCGHPECNNTNMIKRPWNYYKIKIYGPWDVLVDLANDAADAAHNAFDWIKQLLIWGGIGFAIIIGILIIYKVIEHFLNKSSESVPTINIRTNPQNSFGNKNILGNLSKYRNYGYMGICNYKYPV